jgi:hypothetical protein
MRVEDQILCCCTRQDFDDQHKHRLYSLCQSHRINWENVLATANLNQVSPLVYTHLNTFAAEFGGIPPGILSQFKQRYMHNVIVKKRTAEIIEKILAFLAEKEMPAMLLKGAALDALVYRQPWYTCMSDVDLILRARQEDIPDDERWQIDEEFNRFNLHSNAYQVHIEYDFYTHHDMTINGLIDIDPERVWQEARQICFHGQPVWIMSPEDLLIASAINSCRKRFFRLKSACDLSALIEKYPDLDWQAVTSKSNSYRCNNIVYTALITAQRMLGVSIPEQVFFDLQVHPLRAWLIRFLVGSLLKIFPLRRLSSNKPGNIMGREPGWGLVLTYATYRIDQIVPKLLMVYRSRS